MTIAIVGPTASGKTALSIEVARRIPAEIISVDSRQLYRGMDIGTAKATRAQRAAVPHHGLDLVRPDQRFSAGEFARLARRWTAEIRGRGRVPLLVGGTGFFLRALTHPIFREPEIDPARRDALRALLGAWPDDALHRWLEVLDPASARRLSDWGGRQRLIRALEMPLLTGRTLPWWHEHAPREAEPMRIRVFVLTLPRDRLRAAIDARVADMARAGLVGEVEALVAAGYAAAAPGMNATGYAELLPYLRGECSLDDALERIRRNTRAYARRQMTWFRHQLAADAVWMNGTRPLGDLADEIAGHHGAAHDSGDSVAEPATPERAADAQTRTEDR